MKGCRQKMRKKAIKMITTQPFGSSEKTPSILTSALCKTSAIKIMVINIRPTRKNYQ